MSTGVFYCDPDPETSEIQTKEYRLLESESNRINVYKTSLLNSWTAPNLRVEIRGVKRLTSTLAL